MTSAQFERAVLGFTQAAYFQIEELKAGRFRKFTTNYCREHYRCVHDVKEAAQLGWEFPIPTDRYSCHHDTKGVLAHWPHERALVFPGGTRWAKP